MSIPPTSNRSDWPRLVAQDVNKATNDITAAVARIGALEGATAYTVDTVTFTPTTAPGSPVAGMTYFDSGTTKLRTWDGSAWQDHW